MTSLTVRLNDELYERLRKAAFERKWSLNHTITVALDELLDQLDKEASQ